MRYYSFDGKPVNEYWYALLSAARAAGVPFGVNSAKRSIGEQWRLYRMYLAGTGNLAAYPSPTAPHIRAKHAIDFDGAQNVIDFAARNGVHLYRTVPGEEWHVGWSDDLVAFARRHRSPLPLRQGATGRAVHDAQVWLRRGGYLPRGLIDGRFGPQTKTAVTRFQRHVHLKDDGVIGPKTWAALRRRYSWKAWKGGRR